MHSPFSYGIVKKTKRAYLALGRIKVRADQHEDCDCTAK